ncbi:SMP-30/gluconolactonase/LRE family protein [Pseudomonas chlororaphis]|uniref:SMP-30/gluconolactonase/LRE family protein n=1 Tax=Pseudomonas chlororaphis TaxID=587753 RepID=UPI000F575A70|nr:SMP-30/gluconolactonase/LRE family protein [Pseudomonas chlororaphis]AZE06847.1 L-arabinolactonase [Pseudomonas chlororaphis subsp. aureofaciens]AZE13050.1 L-arabinolactonase [Pseudomonas chlororaphis subsp. aureofaciens]KAA5837601.1 SMP-30/gluconolactonase/LRE family protein [Pseudomonas chlororaphis]MBP5063264.1 SMP-30/gluconolactonase/LRE family protein [Pseudomonas chlororaphis]QTT96159.1 SMP-30/gluconolactonase/LRE family protein [Pseudomonas chlororaphis]
MSWTALTAHRAQLGEGPFWDAPDQALYWVDIAGRQALRLCGERLQAWQLPEPVSAFIPCERGDALVTLSSGVYRLDLGSAPAAPRLSLLCVADPQPGNRANEARCDAQGRLWLGTMQNNIGEQGEDLPVRRRSGGLFRIDTQARVTPLLQGLGIPNTLLWSEDASRLYFADSLEGTLYQYPIASDGRLEPARSWFGPHPRGVPDGSAMDAQGYIWNARWDGGCLLRLAPDGEVDRVLELPVSRPTSCVFGGADLKTLYITSAASPLDHPLDGAVLAVRVDTPGKLCHRFAG